MDAVHSFVDSIPQRRYVANFPERKEWQPQTAVSTQGAEKVLQTTDQSSRGCVTQMHIKNSSYFLGNENYSNQYLKVKRALKFRLHTVANYFIF